MFQDGNSIYGILYKVLDPKTPRKIEEVIFYKLFNNKVQKKHNKIIFRRTPTYHLAYQRKTTDSGLSRWLEDSSQNGFHLDDGKVTILNDCALFVIVDGIKY